MKKENRHPNQPQLKSGLTTKGNQSSSGVGFKPRFIVKDTSTISCQDIHLNPRKMQNE